MDYYEIITKLIGPISPIGKTEVDDARFENLNAMIDMVDKLLTDIDNIASNKNRHEYSMKRAGIAASDFFDHLGIKE